MAVGREGQDSKVPTGKVKWFDTEKGFGFLSREGGPDVFVHKDALPAGVATLKPGLRVEANFFPLARLRDRRLQGLGLGATIDYWPSIVIPVCPNGECDGAQTGAWELRAVAGLRHRVLDRRERRRLADMLEAGHRVAPAEERRGGGEGEDGGEAGEGHRGMS